MIAHQVCIKARCKTTEFSRTFIWKRRARVSCALGKGVNQWLKRIRTQYIGSESLIFFHSDHSLLVVSAKEGKRRSRFFPWRAWYSRWNQFIVLTFFRSNIRRNERPTDNTTRSSDAKLWQSTTVHLRFWTHSTLHDSYFFILAHEWKKNFKMTWKGLPLGDENSFAVARCAERAHRWITVSGKITEFHIVRKVLESDLWMKNPLNWISGSNQGFTWKNLQRCVFVLLG